MAGPALFQGGEGARGLPSLCLDQFGFGRVKDKEITELDSKTQVNSQGLLVYSSPKTWLVCWLTSLCAVLALKGRQEPDAAG